MQNVWPAVVVVVDKLACHTTEQHRLAPYPGAISNIRKSSISVVMVQAVKFMSKMGDVNVHQAVAIHIRGVDSHAGLIPPVLAGRQSRYERRVCERAVMIVKEQKVWPGIVGNGNVGPAVAIEVGHDHAHPFRLGQTDTRFVAYVGKCSIVVVMVKLGSLSPIVIWIAICAISGTSLSAPLVGLWGPIEVVEYHKVEPAILVIVQPSRAGRPVPLVGNACLGGNICKSPVSIVMVEDSSPISGY